MSSTLEQLEPVGALHAQLVDLLLGVAAVVDRMEPPADAVEEAADRDKITDEDFVALCLGAVSLQRRAARLLALLQRGVAPPRVPAPPTHRAIDWILR